MGGEGGRRKEKEKLSRAVVMAMMEEDNHEKEIKRGR